MIGAYVPTMPTPCSSRYRHIPQYTKLGAACYGIYESHPSYPRVIAAYYLLTLPDLSTPRSCFSFCFFLLCTVPWRFPAVFTSQEEGHLEGAVGAKDRGIRVSKGHNCFSRL